MDQDQQAAATSVEKVENMSESKDNFMNYINASFINTSASKKVFVATSAPVNKTINSFHQMI